MATAAPAVNFYIQQNQDLVRQQLEAQRVARIADALTQQGAESIQYDRVGAISPLQGLAKMLQAYQGRSLTQEAIEKQAKAQSEGARAMLGAYGGGDPSPERQQFDTGQAALAQVASGAGATGPTRQAAALADQLAPLATGGQRPTALNPYGAPPMIAMAAAQGDPAAQAQLKFFLDNKSLTNQQKESRDPLIGNQVQANLQSQNQVPLQKLLSQRAQVPDGSPQAQALDAAISKENYIAPIDAKPGTPVLDARTLQPKFFAPKTGEGVGLDFANPMAPTAYQLPGYAQANAGIQGAQAQAEQLGKEAGTVRTGVDSTGAPAYALGIPQGAQGTVGGAPVATTSGPPGTVAQQNAIPDIEALVRGAQQRLADSKPGSPTYQSAQSDITEGLAEIARLKGGNQRAALPGPGRPAQAPSFAPGNAPGYNTFQEANAKAAGERHNTMITQAAESPVRIGVLDKIIDLSQKGVNTGPGSDWQNNVAGMAANLPGFKDTATAKHWKGEVSDYQELSKFLHQNAQRAWQAAGGTGTDAQLEATTQANVNSKMFPQALQGVANWAKAGELALQAKVNAAQAQNINDPRAQAQFESTWRNNFDPVIYQLKTQTPAEQAQTVAALKQAGKYEAVVQKAQMLKQMGGL